MSQLQVIPLSLLPPSCKIAPIRDLGDMTFDTLTFYAITLNMASDDNITMGVDSFNALFWNTCDNYDEVRGHSLALSAHSPRTALMFSSDYKEDYAIRLDKQNNRMDEDKPVTPSSSVQLEYVTSSSQNGQVSKTANITNTSCHQHVSNKVLALNQPVGSNVVNIQLNYDINQALEPEFWDGEFHAISLHSSMEYLASDVKNIKDSLSRMCKYILGKTINDDKANNIKDLEDIGEVAWEFISAIYEAHWNSLFVDNSKTSFRNKVKSKFNPQVIKTPVNNKEKEIVKPTFISPLSPPIPAKLPKEVNKISRYFKKNEKQPQKKSYAQVSSLSKSNSSNIAMDTLKIKETFSYLHNKKINQV